MADALTSGTAQGLLAFLAYAGDKGLMNPTTASARRSACSKVLEIDGDEWETLDVRQLDVDDQISRFQRLCSARYTPGSLRTYGQRFRDAVGEYRAYLTNPAGFRSQSTRSAPAPRRNTKDGATERAQGKPPQAAAGSALITYPFPLTQGGIAYVQLPRELAASDARRLARFIEALAVDAEE
jgi:hypothetical protein